MACRALLAREWFALYGPEDAQPLPVSGIEINELKYRDPFSHILSCFAYSLRSQDWDINFHPNFDDFARGVMASTHAPELVLKSKALRLRYPPRPLASLSPALVWEPRECPPRTCGMLDDPDHRRAAGLRAA
jgi:hypothetical protein